MLGLMLRFAALLVFLAAATNSLWAELNPEAGAFLFQKYTAKDYASSPQTWVTIQDARGVVYAGTTDGLLEFDGVSWRAISLTVRSGVRALAIDSQGTVFVGGQGIFGYLAADGAGITQFVSLLNKVPLTDRSFSDIWDVLPTADGVYFASHRKLFLYTSSGAIKVFRPNDRFGRAFLHHQELFVTSRDRGLLSMRNQQLVKQLDDGNTMRSNVLFDDGAVPLMAASKKLYRFSPGSISPFANAGAAYFQEHGVECLKQLAGGDIAVGTKNGGLVLLTRRGEIERVIGKKDGLPSEWVTNINVDREGGIWLTTDSGLARFVRKVTSYSEAQGVRGNVLAIGRLGGQIYAGTSLGLFRMRTAAGSEPVFDPVPEIQDMVLDIVERGNLQLVGGKNGIYILSGTHVEHILDAAVVFDMSFSQRDPNILYTAGSDGIQVLKHEGNTWKVINKERGGGHEFRMVMEAADGRVWGGTANAIWRVDFSVQPPKAEQFNASNGLPTGYENLYRLHDHVVFATDKGLLQFSESAQRFIPDGELGDQFSNGHLSVTNVQVDALKDVWLTGSGYHGVLRGNSWFRQPLLTSGIDEIWSMYLDPDGTCWAAGASGQMFRYHPAGSAKSENFAVLLRSVEVTNQNRILFGGSGVAKARLKLPYRNNALRFEFAAPFFEGQSAVEYQVRLDGSDSDWTTWSSETRKDYTNLPEGTYHFHVRARNPHGTVSSEALFRFSMLPPWYRTWWAYAFYVAAFLMAGWMILRWRLRALQERNKWLERVVEERTAEVRTERDQNEALLLNILPKPVASELRSTGSVKPTAFEDVTVCFSDFVGFTLSSEKLPAQELISSLNVYFTAFDEIIGRYGLEKLKTIGDAYMFASGLPNASPSHAVDAVLAALEMVEVARKLARPENGVDWSIRLGLYSGPVVAGVVGVRKFAFDIWGNTVNFAARMESAGAANRVNLSETTGARVFDFIECEPRGPVRIKEGREMEMFFALKPKQELLAGPMVGGIPEAFRIKYEQAFSKSPKSFPGMNGEHGG